MIQIRPVLRAFALPAAIFGAGLAAQAQIAPPLSANSHAYEASPDVYQLIGEDDHFRVILARWKPGQSDAWHTHHGDLVNYALTDCKLEGQIPGGQSGAFERKQGEAGFNPKGSIHKVRNAGDGDCVLLIVERK